MPITAHSAHSGRSRRGAVAATLLAAALLAPTTAGASGKQVLADCAAGTLAAQYTLADYREALAEMPTDMAEYTACAAEIKASRDRMLAAAAGAQAAKAGRPTRAPYAAAAPTTAGAASTVAPKGSSGFAGGAESDAERSPRDAARATTPTRAPSEPSAPTHDVTADDGVLGLTVAGSGGGDGPSSGSDHPVPLIPALLAFCVIALGATRGLIAWNSRPERLAEADAPGAA